ncbi:MAG: hypothetical protein M3R16_06345 [Pseudomonadota bacterium]|nr:hypothetical protein [Pseudomonadota bacterium]
MKVRALQGFNTKAFGSVAADAVFDVPDGNRGAAEALIEQGYLSGSRKDATVEIADTGEAVTATPIPVKKAK